MTVNIEVNAHNMELNDRLYDYAFGKAEKLEKYLSNIQEARIELTHSKNARQATDRYVAQITIHGKGYTLRAEERTDDIYASFDKALDKLHRRMERYKGKHYDSRGKDAMDEAVEEMAEDEEEDSGFTRRKKFTLIPMSEEEALEQSKLLGHEDFFVFYNAETAAVNVIYLRRDGTYGLIETEIG